LGISGKRYCVSLNLNENDVDFKRDIALHEKNAAGDQPFTLNKHVMTCLDQWDQSVDHRGSTVDGMD